MTTRRPDPVVEIAEGLLRATLSGSLQWTKPSRGTTIFVVQIADGASAQVVSVDGDGVAPYRLDIRNSQGDIVESKRDTNGTWLKELYEAARRNALGTDKVINSILDALKQT